MSVLSSDSDSGGVDRFCGSGYDRAGAQNHYRSADAGNAAGRDSLDHPSDHYSQFHPDDWKNSF